MAVRAVETSHEFAVLWCLSIVVVKSSLVTVATIPEVAVPLQTLCIR
jgi:hypothetical protein